MKRKHFLASILPFRFCKAKTPEFTHEVCGITITRKRPTHLDDDLVLAKVNSIMRTITKPSESDGIVFAMAYSSDPSRMLSLVTVHTDSFGGDIKDHQLRFERITVKDSEPALLMIEKRSFERKSHAMFWDAASRLEKEESATDFSWAGFGSIRGQGGFFYAFLQGKQYAKHWEEDEFSGTPTTIDSIWMDFVSVCRSDLPY